MSADQAEFSIDEEVFLQELHDALFHLRDLPFRRSHPLCRRLGLSDPVTTTRLQQILIDAVDELHPPSHLALDAPRWRRYRYLKLRYVEGAPLEQIVTELRISGRQARREHHAALQELAALLVRQHVTPSDQKDDGLAVKKTSAIDYSAERPVPVPDSASADLEVELEHLESTPQLEYVELRTALADALDIIAPLANARSVTIDYDRRIDLPAVIASRMVLRQILLNLMSFSIGGQQTRHLSISATESPAGVEIHFVPTDPRDDTITTGGNWATGDFAPSLAVASRLAEGLEGSLQVEATAPGRVGAHLLLLTANATCALVVDDNPSVVRLFRRFLRGTGFRLVQARNGFRALELARTLHPDVIVLDLMMPVHDGWDLFRSLQNDPTTATVPVIACSILPERDLALARGACDFLAKPVTPERLLAALAPYRRPRRQQAPLAPGATAHPDPL